MAKRSPGIVSPQPNLKRPWMPRANSAISAEHNPKKWRNARNGSRIDCDGRNGLLECFRATKGKSKTVVNDYERREAAKSYRSIRADRLHRRDRGCGARGIRALGSR